MRDGTHRNGNNELADQHTQSSPDEKGAASKALNRPERHWCRAHIDESRDKRDQEGVGDSAELLEEDSAKVENEVDTGPLLHHLQRRAKNDEAKV